MENKVIHGNCVEELQKLKDKSVDLIYADMVYDDLDFKWLDECKRILKESGSIYVQTDYRSVAQLKLKMDNLFIFRNWIVWCYKGIPRKGNHFQFNHDDILFYTKSEDYVWNQQYQRPSESNLKRWGKYANKNGEVPKDKLTPSMIKKGKTQSIRPPRCRDWWDDISVIGFKELKKVGLKHPFQKPIELIKRIILTSTNEGDLVLDPFAGSGTTALACINLNRYFTLIEIDKEWVKKCNERLKCVKTSKEVTK